MSREAQSVTSLPNGQPETVKPIRALLSEAVSSVAAALLTTLSAIARWFAGLNWRIVWLQAQYCAWNLLTKSALGVCYFVLIAEGIRARFSPAARKLYKIPLPFFANLEYDEVGHKLDIAHLLALGLLLAVWVLWEELLLIWLRRDSLAHASHDALRHAQVIVSLSIPIIGGDAFLFYTAVGEMGWSGDSISFTAIILTAAYVAILGFVGLVSINIRQRITQLRQGESR